MRLDIQIVSDVVCPWCFIGKRRLAAALHSLDGRVEPHVEWRPFELNPRLPLAGVDRRQYLQAKFGSAEAVRALESRLVAVGQAEGIAFAFEQIERTPNTFEAHRLIWLAEREGGWQAMDRLVEALFTSYFLKGADLTRRTTLITIAGQVGLSTVRVERALSSDEGIEAVRRQEDEAQQAGIRAVPYFILNGTFALSGAQPSPVLQSAFERVMGNLAS